MDWYAFSLVVASSLVVVVAVGFFVSGLDDLLVDIVYLLREAWRALVIRRKYPRLTVRDLYSRTEKPAAVLVPAWQEQDVIQQMLEHLLSTVNYSNFHVFVGTYPNDEPTQHAVERARARHPRIHRIITPKDGPTCKADCLNWLCKGIQLYEKQNGIRFEFFVLHDAEDVVHPLSLKLYNYLIPRKDMIQIPVFALETQWHQWVAGTYMDEFAEFHTKNLLIRELLGKSIPSAGVGTAISRAALERMSKDRNDQIFNIDSLTEDYEFGLRLGLSGLNGIFVRQRIVVPDKPGAERKEFIATREFFPTTFRSACRQKARWTLGITLQGWRHLGWKGGIGRRYMLFQDRKALLTNPLTLLGYVVLAIVSGISIYSSWRGENYHYQDLVSQPGWVWNLIIADTVLLVHRLVMRFLFVARIYGVGQGLLSMPRSVVLNFINATATLRAIRLHLRYLRTGELGGWDKTSHVFPTFEEMAAYRRRLGDLLLERRDVDVNQLEHALAEQARSGQPLGAVLIRQGAASPDQIAVALSQQLGIPVRTINPDAIPIEILRRFPPSLAVAFGAMPVEQRDGTLVVASYELLTRSQIREIEEVVGMPVEVELAMERDVTFAIRTAYEALKPERDGLTETMVIRRLVSRGALTVDQACEARNVQKAQYRPLAETLILTGKLTPETMRAAHDLYRRSGTGRVGDFLVEKRFISAEDRDAACELQRRALPDVTRILVARGYTTPELIAAVQREESA